MARQTIKYWQDRPARDHGDWLEGEGEGDWLKGYKKSQSHPHRRLIIGAILSCGEVDSVVEAGCNCGPNLAFIRDELKIPENSLAGIDASEKAIAFGKRELPEADLRVGDMKKLPWRDGVFSIALADASLMYCDDEESRVVLKELIRVSRKAIIIVDRIKGNDFIWGRDYGELLGELGYEVEAWKLGEADWPTSRGWQQDGFLWLARKK